MKQVAYPILLILLLINSQKLYAQKLTGKVTDTQGEGVPYTQIGVNGTEIYTLSNSEGDFTINLPKSVNTKQLFFLAPGYKTISYSIDSLLTVKEVKIRLREAVKQVSGTVLKSQKLKTRIKGNKVPPIGAMQLSLSQTNTSYGISERVPGKQTMLRVISFNVQNDTILNLTVRPFAYAVIDGEIDYNNLITKNKIFAFKAKKGWLTMDLTDMDINVSGTIIFGVEWISVDGQENPLTSMSLTFMSGRNSFQRVGLQKITPYKGLGSFSIKGTFEYY